ncbi:MAG: glycoside hydrolase family 3 C-terminal domain-containing protein [Prevotella sp.]|nr:glycoside hydrolase family 3 C-terminal domain-containing protein [Prevotella sp.]
MKRHFIFMLLLLETTIVSAQLPYQNRNLSAEERATDLCSRLTLDEKAKLMCNASPSIERLGIPAFEWWSEGLHGVGRNGFATVFPATIGMAASFDDNLLYKIYDAVSDEARAKNTIARKTGFIKRYQGLSFWTPNINIFRDPRWGRGQETYGEDPYLTTCMGLAVVRGLQGPEDTKYRKLLACAKHFAVHSGPEWNRHSFNVENLPQRDLWETYLPAFKALVQDGNVQEVMCAYQRIDGEPCCGNNRYLQQILRNEWNFKGLVTSDCGAISDFWEKGRHGVSTNAEQASSKAVRSGTDTECGSNYLTLPEAVKNGEISEKQIDVSLKRLLKARFELGDFDSDSVNDWTKIPESVVASKSHKEMALQMAREEMVLLMNKNNILPLNKNMKIVVMGPNACDSTMMWGNYNGYPTETVTILKGIQNKAKNVIYVAGCGLINNSSEKSFYNDINSGDGIKGMKATYYNNLTQEGSAAAIMQMREPIRLDNGGGTVFAPGVNLTNFSGRYTGVFIPEKSDKLTFKVAGDDGFRLIVNGDTIIDSWKSQQRVVNKEREMYFESGKKYNLELDYKQEDGLAMLSFDVVKKINLLNGQILSSVKDADAVVFVGGISPRLEGEEMKVDFPGFKGGDRTNIELPDVQRQMIGMLHKAGKKVVYINCSGSAIGLVPETQNADAILQAWYPGEQGGTAVADVLFGDYNPCGKLPVTFYKNVGQLPDYEDYKMEGRTYRYFKGEALFPFGYGLNYTTYKVSNTRYDSVNGKLYTTVSNVGKKDGTDVIQVYIKNVDDKSGPIKSLRAFLRVHVNAGESKSVTIDMPRNKFEGWDTKTNTIRVVPGTYHIMVGNSSMDKDLRVITVKI